MKNSHLVSVIMPIFNSELYLNEAITSVVEQTYQNFELLIIDNGSSDRSLDIAKKWEVLDCRIRVLTEDRKGAAYARNAAIKNSNGDFLSFLDSDDIWEVDKLEMSISFMIKDKVKLCCTDYTPISSTGISVLNVRKARRIISHSDLLRTCDIGCSTVVIDIREFECSNSIPKFPVIQKEDYAYWFDLIEVLGQPFASLPYSLTKYRLHNNGISSNKYKEIRKQFLVYRNHLHIDLFMSLIYTSLYIFYGLKKSYFNGGT